MSPKHTNTNTDAGTDTGTGTDASGIRGCGSLDSSRAGDGRSKPTVPAQTATVAATARRLSLLSVSILIAAFAAAGCHSSSTPRLPMPPKHSRPAKTTKPAKPSSKPGKSQGTNLVDLAIPAPPPPAPHSGSQGQPPTTAAPTKFPVVTALNPKRGLITSVNHTLRFVVLDFGLNGTPNSGERLVVLRNGQSVGRLRISGTSQGGLVAADILEGTIEPGDEARPEAP